jgi:hypothetical protein
MPRRPAEAYQFGSLTLNSSLLEKGAEAQQQALLDFGACERVRVTNRTPPFRSISSGNHVDRKTANKTKSILEQTVVVEHACRNRTEFCRWRLWHGYTGRTCRLLGQEKCSGAYPNESLAWQLPMPGRPVPVSSAHAKVSTKCAMRSIPHMHGNPSGTGGGARQGSVVALARDRGNQPRPIETAVAVRRAAHGERSAGREIHRAPRLRWAAGTARRAARCVPRARARAEHDARVPGLVARRHRRLGSPRMHV